MYQDVHTDWDWARIPRLRVVEGMDGFVVKTSSVVDYEKTQVRREGNLYLTSLLRRKRVVGYVFKFRSLPKLKVFNDDSYIIATYKDDPVRPVQAPKMLIDTTAIRAISLGGNYFVAVKISR